MLTYISRLIYISYSRLRKLCTSCLLVFFVVQFTAEEEAAIKDPIIKKYEHEGHPYFSSARSVDYSCTHVITKCEMNCGPRSLIVNSITISSEHLLNFTPQISVTLDSLIGIGLILVLVILSVYHEARSNASNTSEMQ